MRGSLDLEDHLASADLGASLRTVTGPAGDIAALPPRVEELGVTCPNVALAAAYLEARWPKMRPFFIGAGSPTEFVQEGKVVPFTTRVGFGYYNGVIIELCEPGVGSDVFGRTPADAGQLRINHLGFFGRAPDLTRTDARVCRSFSANLALAGYRRRVEASVNTLGFIAHVQIFDPDDAADPVGIEFLDFRLFSKRGIKLGYPAALVSFGGWLQKHHLLLPRVVSLRPQAQLPPAPE